VRIPLSLALSIKKLAFSVSNYKITIPGLSTHVTSRWEKIWGSNSKSLLRACQKERFRCADAHERKRKRRLQHMEEQHSLYEE
jgi:hypothetical protein